jgi:hypothetical protein
MRRVAGGLASGCLVAATLVGVAGAAGAPPISRQGETASNSMSRSSSLLALWRVRSQVLWSTRFTVLSTPASTPVGNGPTAPTLGTSYTTPFLQGAYVGPADPSGVRSFASETKSDVTIASDYLPASDGWAGMDGENGSLNWLVDAWENSGFTLSLGVPLIPTNAQGEAQGTLAQGATGSYNAYFAQLASTLVASGNGDAYLRLGWEFDGNWYAWQAQSARSEGDYAAYFRQVVTAMRSVPGANFKFVWNPDASAFASKGYSVEAAYPGSSYVNVIGLDLYDMSWASPSTPQNAWTSTYLPELSDAETFALSQNEPLALCEWGALIRPSDHGLGDDPYYVTSMIDWMKTAGHDVVYESYFNGVTSSVSQTTDQNLDGANFSSALAAYQAGM